MNEDIVMMPKDPFVGLKPAALWKHFAKIVSIPRPGGQEAAVIEWLANWADKNNFSHRRDSAGNICIYVPASQGLSDSPTIALQAHLDMVCIAAEKSSSDPGTGKIDVIRDGDWIAAPESTLGADNGIGITAAMAFAESDNLPHGPLELLFTVEEETTFKGAIELDPNLIKAEVMLNLDGESGELIIGCAGGIESLIIWPAPTKPIPEDWTAINISLTGLTGGHSGGDIEKNRLNGIKGIVWLIQKIKDEVPICLCELSGGDAFNAIPLHAQTTIAIPPKELPNLDKLIDSFTDGLTTRFSLTDPDLTLSKTTIDDQGITCWSDEDCSRLVDLLSAIPSGVIAMEHTSPHLVETSNNLGVVKVKDNTLGIVCFTRSSVWDAQEQVAASIESTARLAGAEFRVIPDKMPPWRVPNDSALLYIARASYRDLFQREPPLASTHGGLECGTIQEHLPELDVISLGPVIQNAHKPGERVSISSASEFYELLSEIIKRLSS
jgi:dipeptidase D